MFSDGGEVFIVHLSYVFLGIFKISFQDNLLKVILIR